MTVFLLVLMAYFVTGQAVHKWVGIALGNILGKGKITLRAATGITALYGAICLIRQNYEKASVLALGGRLAMMALWGFVGYLLWYSIRKTK